MNNSKVKQTKQTNIVCLKIVVILLICSIVLNIYFLFPNILVVEEKIAIELELKEHLVSNRNDIIIRGVSVIQKDSKGQWIFEVHCTNIDMDIDFKQYAKINSASKEITGYNVLEYE